LFEIREENDDRSEDSRRLGGGNGGHAMAADLAMKGYEVRIWEDPDFREAFAPRSNGSRSA